MTNNGKLKTATHQTNEISAKPITTSLKCKWRTTRLLMLFFMVCLLDIPLMALNDMPLLAELMGEHTMSSFGYSIISLDFNHDGYDDLIVLSLSYGYQYPGITTPSKGKVYIYYGGPGFSSTAELTMSLEGDYPNGALRQVRSIANIGDVNGDGFDDLMILDWIPSALASTRYMFYYGGTADLSTPDRIEANLPNESGYNLYKLGDVDGDTYDDIGIVYELNHTMKIDIWWGGAFVRQNISILPDNPTLDLSIIGIGDINCDGYQDFSIGYLGEYQGNNFAKVVLHYGNSNRLFSNSTLLIQTTQTITTACKPLGDINNDGLDDFLGYIDSSGMKVWYGTNAIPLSNPDVILNPILFGNSYVRGVEYGDFNGDGYNDVIGASYNNRQFAIWLGSVEMDGHADLIKGSTMEYFGYDIAVGDFNGDGYDDLAISAPFNDLGPAWEHPGYVYIYAGGIGMVDNADLLTPPDIQELRARIYPNPIRNNGKINLEVTRTENKEDEIVKLLISNVKGQQILAKEDIKILGKQSLIPLEITNLPNGVYLCQVIAGDKHSTTKFTIMK